MNYYPNYNQFYNTNVPQMPKMQSTEQQYPQYNQTQYTPTQPLYKPFTGLQGKSVDNIEVVKAMDIPLDGTISYFPITDGTAIVTKQLQPDGSSKTIVYKPVEEQPIEQKEIKYITPEELDEKLKDIGTGKDFKDEIKTMKRKIENLTEDIKDINDSISKRKD